MPTPRHLIFTNAPALAASYNVNLFKGCSAQDTGWTTVHLARECIKNGVNVQATIAGRDMRHYFGELVDRQDGHNDTQHGNRVGTYLSRLKMVLKELWVGGAARYWDEITALGEMPADNYSEKDAWLTSVDALSKRMSDAAWRRLHGKLELPDTLFHEARQDVRVLEAMKVHQALCTDLRRTRRGGPVWKSPPNGTHKQATTEAVHTMIFTIEKIKYAPPPSPVCFCISLLFPPITITM
jgi:hypothetical protein